LDSHPLVELCQLVMLLARPKIQQIPSTISGS
jgi:hypothetical protein